MFIFKWFRQRCQVRTVIATLAVAALATLVGMGGVIRAGWYDVSATGQHWQVSFTTMEWAMRWSVQHHARNIIAPPLTQAVVQRGAVVYREQCVQCHGAPGISPDAIGLSMQPLPGPLVHMMQRWKSEEIYWIVSNGIKMSGMPAWRYRLSAADMWAVTALVTRLPTLSPEDYATLQLVAQYEAERVGSLEGLERRIATSVSRGKLAIPQYACQSCHQIPGVVGGKVQVGPALDGYETHQYIAGHLTNTRTNLAQWLRETQHIKPHSAMPELGVTEQDAADIAAYLLAGKLRE